MNPHFIDDLAQRLAGLLPPGVQHLKQDIERNMQAVLRTQFEKLDLVTRDEFDAQARVLARTRTMVESLEKKVAELEQQLGKP